MRELCRIYSVQTVGFTVGVVCGYLFIFLLIIFMPKKKEEQVQESFQRHDKDTWSVEVQIGLLCDEIKQLQAHLAANKNDFDAKRSLLKKVARRRTQLKYLKTKKLSTYNAISKQVNVKV